MTLRSLATTRAANPPRVLIGEDDDEMRRLLVEYFIRNGWEAQGASDGAELLEQASVSPRPPDLIISDQHMPKMSGLAVLQALASGGVSPPFILITSFGAPTLHAEAEMLVSVRFSMRSLSAPRRAPRRGC